MAKFFHIAEHFFKGVCICPCVNCTTHVRSEMGGKKLDLVKCVCTGCDRERCGARNGC